VNCRRLASLAPAAIALWTAGAVVASEPRFVERAHELGIDFVHDYFGGGEKYMPENMAPGVVVLDYDGDGLDDLYFVQGEPFDGSPAPNTGNRLYRRTEQGRYEEVTARAGAAGSGYGMGASVGDVDGDGDPDLYLANYGPDVLLENLGDGTFRDATATAGLGSALWSTGSTFCDADEDGDLDLYVAAYVDFALDNHHWCGSRESNLRSYCHPDVYEALPDRYYRNDGRGHFEEVGAASGIVTDDQAKGLGVACADLTGDGHLDFLVANDSTFNYLFRGDGAGSFSEEGLFEGLAVNSAGQPEASMGIAIGDLDGDGVAEVLFTHLDQETNTLYRRGESGWVDVTEAAGLAAPSLPWVGFGDAFFDYDDDGDLDLIVTNGHIIDNIEAFDSARAYRQPLQLFANDGAGHFSDVSDQLGVAEPLVGRGLVTGDLDRDGDPDVVLAQNGARVLFLENRGSAHPAVQVRLAGRGGNTAGYGARLALQTDGRRIVRWVRANEGYLSQGPPEVLFGLGSGGSAPVLDIAWPAGARQRLRSVPSGRRLLVPEPFK
jgi:hypothetical protein